jgi:GDP-L-fucose synthase
VVGYQGEVVWETGRADGTPRKLLDVSAMQSLGWRSHTALEEGIRLAYDDFLLRCARGEAMHA